MYVRKQFVRSICCYGLDVDVKIDFISQAKKILRDYPETRSVFFTTIYHYSTAVLKALNDQMTIDQCY